MHTKFYLDKLKGSDHLRDRNKEGRVILKWVLKI